LLHDRITRATLAGAVCTLAAAGLVASEPAVAPASAGAGTGWTVTDVSPPGATSATAYGISAAGDVAGGYATAAGAAAGFRWHAGTATQLPGVDNWAVARALDDAGGAYGAMYDGNGGQVAVRWSPDGTTRTSLGALNGNYSEVFAVNGTGNAAGDSYGPTGQVEAVAWDAGATSPSGLGGLVPGGASHARSINSNGVIAGDADVVPGGARHAVTWGPDGITDLGTPVGYSTTDSAYIDDLGHVAGRALSDPAPGPTPQPQPSATPGPGSTPSPNPGPSSHFDGFFWDGTTFTIIPPGSGGTFVEVAGIAATPSGEVVVGRTDAQDAAGYHQFPFIWHPGDPGPTDLNSLLAPGSMTLQTPFGVNRAGQIVGQDPGGYHALLLSPPSGSGSVTTTATGDADGRTLVTTDPAGTGATAGAPVQTSIDFPLAEGQSEAVAVSVSDPAAPAPTGYSFLGKEVTIDLPGITAPPSAPIVITFLIDGSLSPDPDTITLTRTNADGSVDVAQRCTSPGVAAPDPCLTAGYVAPGTGPGSDVVMTVYTTHASRWAPIRRSGFTFTGFAQPVDNPPVLNAVKAGATVPVRFSLGGNQGTSIFAFGYPQVTSIPCPARAVVDQIEQTTTSKSKLTYDPRSGYYTYGWRSPQSPGCVRLDLKFADGTDRYADFRLR
jgi:uncharacterized membrane protein